MAQPDSQAPPRRRARWGLRTLGFLLLAVVAVFTAQAMGGHTIGTLGSTVFGLGGAFYCSVRGIRDARERGLAGLLTDRRPPR